MLIMWYDEIVVIIIILFNGNYVIEIETHNYLLHVSLYKRMLNLIEVMKGWDTNYKEFLEGFL